MHKSLAEFGYAILIRAEHFQFGSVLDRNNPSLAIKVGSFYVVTHEGESSKSMEESSAIHL